MKITFTKTVTDHTTLKPYMSLQEPVRKVYRGRDSDLIGIKYDLRKIEKDLVDNLEDIFKQKGYQTTRHANNKLWIRPDRFSLNLDVKMQEMLSPHVESLDPDYLLPQHGNFEKVETRVINKGYNLFGTIFRNEIDVYQEVPSIFIRGKVDYEDLEKVEPTDVLEILTEQGYTSHIITTPHEVEVIIRELKTRGKLVETKEVLVVNS